MTEEIIPKYIVDLKADLIKHFDEKIEKEVGALAVLTAKQFVLIDERFNEIDKKFALVDERFNEIDKKFTLIDERFGLIDERFVKISIEFDTINNRLDHIETDIYEIKGTIVKIERYIGRYEVRAQNIENILLEEHKPRIITLEKEVFGV